MRAVVLERLGAASDALTFHPEWPLPQRKPGEVLVQAAATSMNAGEWNIRSGYAPIPVKLPKILGEDLAGVVVEAAEDSKFKKGDRVFAGTGQFSKSGDQGGCYAEYVSADEHTLCLIPEGVSFQEAGAVPVAGLTAWQALEPVLPLEGKRILVLGGSGGVGGFAIQIAKAYGAHVTTTCSTSKVDYVKEKLGADVVIDYTKDNWEAAALESLEGQRYDFVLDLIGGSYQAASLRLVAPKGQVASVGASGPGHSKVSLAAIVWSVLDAGWRTLMGKLRLAPKFHFVLSQSRASKGLEQIAELMRHGKFKVHVDRVFPLEEVAQAHEYMEAGRACGKVGILIKAID